MSFPLRVLHWILRFGSDRLMLPLFERLGETRDSTLGGRLCILRTVGRKSGLPREIPLSYAPTTRGAALLAGFGRGTGWVYNLRAQPRAELQVGHHRYAGTATEVTDPVLARRATRAVLRNAGAAGFFYGWDPRRASEAQIAAVVRDTIGFHFVFDQTPPWAPPRDATAGTR